MAQLTTFSPLNLIYHEKQMKGTLMCGQHVLNSLLQGPYFGVEELSRIAHELDEKEIALMKESGMVNYMPHQSSNVDESGNFSIQVLKAALEGHGITVSRGERLDAALRSLSSDTVNIEEQTAPAFLCHLQAHWFALRYVKDSYWDLNSLFDQPQMISTFHLMAYIGQLKNEGWSIFLVEGEFPPPIRNTSVGLRSSWFEIGKAVDAAHVSISGEDFELQAALAASLEQDQLRESDEDRDLAAALKMSLETDESK